MTSENAPHGNGTKTGQCILIISNSVKNTKSKSPSHSTANSSLFPTSLYSHSNSSQILALKKYGFSEKKIFDPEKVIKRASKVAHNRPRPF